MSYEWFVSLRYLRAKRKQTFISVISFISIAGVTLGVAALIVVLAVMTGFHDGVRQQILGNIPHVLIQSYGEDLADYAKVCRDRARQPRRRSIGATPFVSKEAMLLLAAQCGGGDASRGSKHGNKIFDQRFSPSTAVNRRRSCSLRGK